MPAITEDDIRDLAAVSFKGAQVTSCYLDVDGARRVRSQDVVHSLDLLLKGAKQQANGDPSVRADLRRFVEHVRAGLDRSRVRGLAMFSSSGSGFWRVYELPVPVRDQVVVNNTPAVRQLEVVLDEYERFGVLLADRQRARMFVFELGEVVESDEQFDRLPRNDDDDHSHSKDKTRDHVAAHVSQHLRHAANVAFEVFKTKSFDHLILGAPDEIAAQLESVLHPYLRERVRARCNVAVGASADEVRSAALQVESAVEREKETEAVARLRDAAGAGRKGVTGVDATLAALAERRVETLLVSAGFETPGWRCGECGHVARVGPACPIDGATMHEVADVVEEAVEEALAQHCRVEICVDNADLDVLGRIGALLRY